MIEVNGTWKWGNEADDPFAVKQVRADIEIAKLNGLPDEAPVAWNNWATPKSNLLLWRVLMGKVASWEALINRGIPISDESCPRCGLEVETTDHIFFKCLWAKCIWWNVLAWVRVSFPGDNFSFREFFEFITQRPGGGVWKRIIYTIVLATVWRIWNARNEKVFDGRFIPIKKTVEFIKEDSFLWISNRARNKNPDWENWVKF
ncbi:uncharacterized protein LOC110901248 [Helianthus annuus]|uniref:uncharacterized protein LOC110901248 n=1 Tax=Helianthus annuus TaxID=4232 RepID=UPI000B90667C|nr:uncharacterized protein LOC110901248 [Helianthus annuus]